MEAPGRVKIKLDENLSRHLAVDIRALGHDVDTVFDEQLLGQPDEVVGQAAREASRMLFTLDVEFADLRKHPPGAHPGVVLFRPANMTHELITALILQFVRSTDLVALEGSVVVVDSPRIRIRYPDRFK